MKVLAMAFAALLALNAQAASELKIGFLSTLSGPAGGIGIEIRDGFNLALKLSGGKLGGMPTEVIFAEVYSKLNQLDYSPELAQIRAAKPDALYAFLPGGMGINFIKQFVASGLSNDIQLIVPGFASDQDIVRAVGEPMLGLFDTSHWAYDLDNDANQKFVAEFQKEYKRIPTLF